MLVVVRLAATFRENSRLFELTRAEATTDALTGLGNRRQLLNDLARRLDARPCSRRSSCSSTSTDSRATTTRSAIRPATRSSRGWARSWRPFRDRAAPPTGSEVTSSASSQRSGEGEAEPLIDRACEALTERGEGFEIETSFGAIMLPDEATDASQALQIADERLYAQKYSRRGEGDRTMAALLEALSVRDPELQEQLAGVGTLAGDIGRMLGLRRDELEELDRAAQLHDLGKLAVPDEILSKPGPLDEREWAFVRQHTIVGERILRASPALRSVATVVRASHENWDGSGYPDGLAGEDIPLASRIIRACNAFVAMTSNRPYRDAFSVDDALNELMRCAGTDFDPTVVRVLVARVRDEQEAERAA